MARDMAGNGSSLASVKRAIAPATRGLRTATRHNKKYGPGTILALIALAASSGASAGGCLELREYAEVVGSVPTGEWARRVIQARDADVALRALRASAARQLRALRRHGDLPKGTVVALDMTAILRYGRSVPGWPVRARPGHGQARRERRMTAQCAANGMWITMDAVRAVPGDPVAAAFSTVCGRVLAVCARAGARPVLPVDREFLATGVLARLGRRKTRWPVPCPSYPRVAAALREHAARRRGRVSSMRISDGRGREAPYTMITRKRKRREGDGPEGKHIAFASNSPSPGPDALYRAGGESRSTTRCQGRRACARRAATSMSGSFALWCRSWCTTRGPCCTRTGGPEDPEDDARLSHAAGVLPGVRRPAVAAASAQAAPLAARTSLHLGCAVLRAAKQPIALRRGGRLHRGGSPRAPH